ncbi:MAG: MEDS domain-containing protein [Pseudomonadota bacterium]
MQATTLQKRATIDAFWGELSPCDHSVQIYESDHDFLDALEGYVAAGIRHGDAIILIVTPAHLSGLERRLSANGFNIAAATARGQYFALDARATLDKFLVNGWPDEKLFNELVTRLLGDARRRYANIRAFGEMVALMWAEGHCGATVQLEHLWSRLCVEQGFSLFCAYPKAGFTMPAIDAIEKVCAAHSAVFTLPRVLVTI